MKTIIIGAGPAGLTAAYQLSKETPDVTVFEAADCMGGLARSIHLWGQTVDLGPHRFFSKDRRVNELWLEVVGRDYFMVNRQTRILYEGKLFCYPLEAFDALVKLGPVEALRCLGSYARCRTGVAPVSKLKRAEATIREARLAQNGGVADSVETDLAGKNGSSFEDWVCRRFGRRLFEIFFKTYSEKLWGIPCQELDADFAAQRIKKLSLLEAVKSALLPGQRKRHRTLADEFAYPISGTGMVYERMADAIRRRGAEVCLKSPVKKVLTESVVGSSAAPGARVCREAWENGAGGSRSPHVTRRVVGVELASGETVSCSHVISTMPLTKMVMQLDDVPPEVMEACRQLRFRNTILVYLEVMGGNPFPDQWIYVHSPELRFGRVTNFKNWRPKSGGQKSKPEEPAATSRVTSDFDHQMPKIETTAILAMEYWCDVEDDFWNWNDGKLAALARDEIVRSGLVRHSSRIGQSFVFRIPKCYPIYRRGYREHVDVIRQFLGTIAGLQVIGRYGAFKYNNQDHSILMGLFAAENCRAAHRHDLWNINADYDTYQEACSITDSGLVGSCSGS